MTAINNVDDFYEYLGTFFNPQAVEEAKEFDTSVEEAMGNKYIEELIFDRKIEEFSKLSDEAKVFSSLKYLLRKTALEDNLYWFNPNHKNTLFFDKKTFEKTRYNIELKKTIENFKNYFEKFPGTVYNRDELFDLDAEKWSGIVSALKKYEKKEEKEVLSPKKLTTGEIKKARHFKREYITSYDGMKEIIENQFDSRDIGELPKAWIDMIPKNLIGVKTKMINKAFAEFAEKTSSSRDTPGEFFNSDAAEKLAQKLGGVLGENAKMEFIGQGHYGKAFKIEVGKSKTVLKTFHSDNTTTAKENLEEFGHGSTMEIVRGFFASRNSSKNKFVKVFMGRIGSEEQKDAYMLSEFIDISNAKKGKNKSSVMKIGEMITSGDIKSENLIGNTMIDTGDIKLEKVLQNYQARKMTRRILNALDKGSIERIKELKNKYQDKEEFKTAKEFIDSEFKKRFPVSNDDDTKKKYPFLHEGVMRELGISNKKENNLSLSQLKNVKERNGGA